MSCSLKYILAKITVALGANADKYKPCVACVTKEERAMEQRPVQRLSYVTSTSQTPVK